MRTLLVSLLVFVSSTAFAAERSSYSSSGSSLTAVGVADTTTVTNGESLTALFSMNQNWIQAYLGMYQTKGTFDFAAGGAYKFTVAGNLHTGFHMGPGFTIGTVADDFAFAIFATAGGHFTIVDHLLFSVDGGPMVTHTKGNTNFRIRGLGQLLGASVAYIF